MKTLDQLQKEWNDSTYGREFADYVYDYFISREEITVKSAPSFQPPVEEGEKCIHLFEGEFIEGAEYWINFEDRYLNSTEVKRRKDWREINHKYIALQEENERLKDLLTQTKHHVIPSYCELREKINKALGSQSKD